jgi:phosphonate metabolism-associated iron-containing alcohol dehydrogenase
MKFNKIWSFYNPVKAYFGVSCRKGIIKELNSKMVLIVCSKRGRTQFENDSILSELFKTNQIIWADTVTENPCLSYLENEKIRLLNQPIDAVIGFGGGSALDAAKVLSVSLSDDCQKFSIEDLISQTDLLNQVNSIPLYNITTTSGTGSEVTPFATVWNHKAKKKLSLASNAVFAQAAYIDPELTYGLPLAVTISTGLDAINQAAESYWNKNANPITLAYAIRSMQLGFEALPNLVDNINVEQSRSDMAEASLLAGLAISHTRTGLCHSISYPITSHFGVSHGIACAFTMPAVLEHNLKYDDGRFNILANALLGEFCAKNLLIKFKQLNHDLGVLKICKEIIPSMDSLLVLKDEMFTPGRADNNFVSVDVSTIEELIKKAFTSNA